MPALNKVMLIGYVGKEPEIQFIEGRFALSSFSVATTEKYKDKKGVLQTRTEWHQVIARHEAAELAIKHIHKGDLVYVEGKIHTRSWEDKEGLSRTSVEILSDHILMLNREGA